MLSKPNKIFTNKKKKNARVKNLQLNTVEYCILKNIWPCLKVIGFEFLQSDDEGSLADTGLPLGIDIQQLPSELQLGKDRGEKLACNNGRETEQEDRRKVTTVK